MNLEILSLENAQKFIPKDKTYVIRIYNWDDYMSWMTNPKEEGLFVKVNEYQFDNLWPKDWKEFPEEKDHLNGLGLKFYERETMFDENIAMKIMSDFEPYKNSVDTVLIHCIAGRNRSPAIGMAMNDIYGWGIMGLKEKYPHYTNYIYTTMLKAAMSRK